MLKILRVLSGIVLFPKKLNKSQKEWISEHSHFYHCLSRREKELFEHRVYCFIEAHSFHGNGIKINSQIETLIASMAVTLTFGMPSYLFSRVQSIMVYPESYYSRILQQYHKGETNPKLQLVVFSWVDFLEGMKSTDDNLNLALHEFSHALHLGFKSELSFSGINFRKNFSRILNYLKSRDNRKTIIEASYLRSYAFENKYEFLAVLIEHFFETPDEFKQKLPNLFYAVQQLLNLDILKYYGRKSSQLLLKDQN